MKPSSCSGCSLEHKGEGFAHPIGPPSARLAFIGEALGREEAKEGKPFVGAAGQWMNRMLKRLGLSREEVRIHNVVSCRPPNDWLAGAPWEYDAIAHCRRHLQPVLEENHAVTVALGVTAGRTLCGDSRFTAEFWHGCPVSTLQGMVVPTFHPAHILRGNHNLTGVWLFDVKRAKEISEEGYRPREARLRIDPPVDEFDQWVDDYLSALGRSDPPWLAVDIETPFKGSTDITRVNFACHPDEAWTVPHEGPYIDAIIRLMHSTGVKLFWWARFDVPILRWNGRSPSGTLLDVMDAWHVLQSDLPRELGFVAPFYSNADIPWKHLNLDEPGKYAALDALHTIRIAFEVARDLKEAGMWEAFYRHCHLLDKNVLHPAEEVGLLVDKKELKRFGDDLAQKKKALHHQIQDCVPEECKPLYPKSGWKRPSERDDLIHMREKQPVQVCLGCNQVEVAKTHKCKDEGTPNVQLQEREVDRYYIRQEFNPGSPPQLLSYMQHKGIQPGKHKKTRKPTTDKQTLNRLAKAKDPLFPLILDYRAVDKVYGTYVKGTERRLGKDGRLHSTFTHIPSTLRLSSVDPNLQNVVADKEGSEKLAAGFRRSIVAEEGCYLVEADYAGIEAVETGWFQGDPAYIRLARLGVHSFVCSHFTENPASLSWSDEDLRAYFKDLKKNHPKYPAAKKGVHRTNYGSTPYGMYNDDPDIFGSLRNAQEIQALYYQVCPKLGDWHDSIRRRAHKQHYLGGDEHPFRYKHWFWNVYVYNNQTKKWSLGEDGKRCIAYLPQSTSAGVLYQACLRLMDPEDENYIGDMYEGQTPIRALIHDSILAEVPKSRLDDYCEKVRNVMTAPIKQQPCPADWGIGEYLTLGVEIKVGKSWDRMEEIQ